MNKRKENTPYLKLFIIVTLIIVFALFVVRFIFTYFNIEGLNYLNKLDRKIQINNIEYENSVDRLNRDRQIYLKYVYESALNRHGIDLPENEKTTKWSNILFGGNLQTMEVSEEMVAESNLKFYLENYVFGTDFCEFLFNDKNLKFEDITINFNGCYNINQDKKISNYDIPLSNWGYIIRCDYFYDVTIKGEKHFIYILDSLNDKNTNNGINDFISGKQSSKHTQIFTDIGFENIIKKNANFDNKIKTVDYIFNFESQNKQNIELSVNNSNTNEVYNISFQTNAAILNNYHIDEVGHIVSDGFTLSDYNKSGWGYNYYEITKIK